VSSIDKGNGLDQFVVKLGEAVVYQAKNREEAKKEADKRNAQAGLPTLYS
jgi:hypothetical protein